MMIDEVTPQRGKEELRVKVRPKLADLVHSQRVLKTKYSTQVVEEVLCLYFGLDYKTLEKVPTNA